MEFFNKAKAVRLRSYHDKYLVADEDEETVRQSRSGASRLARWNVEFVDGDSHVIRLKSCFGKYLTATEEPYLFSISGRKVTQAIPTSKNDGSIEWEPRNEEKLVKMKAKGGLYLRANGSIPPWRNSVTHDVPHRAATQDWILWDVDVVDILIVHKLLGNGSSVSSLSSSFNDVSLGSERSSEDGTSMEIVPSRKFNNGNNWNSQGGMEFFKKAKSVRLRSHHDKYLLADYDQETVCQDRNGSVRQAKWTVEIVESTDTVIRLKSCYGKYLAASNEPFLLGMSGKKVLQTLPRRLDSSLEWEPIKEGKRVRLKTRYGNFLRANGGLPPWRNSITHDIPHRSKTQDWILWEIDVVEIQTSPPKARPEPQPQPQLQPQPQPQPQPHSRSQSFASEPDSPTSIVLQSPRPSKLEFNNSYVDSPIRAEGRMIYYKVADDNGYFDEKDEGLSFTFKGSRLEELVQKLEEETCLEDIIVCSQFKGKLYPLRLQLPPNNADMHVVVVPSSSRGAADIAVPASPTSS